MRSIIRKVVVVAAVALSANVLTAAGAHAQEVPLYSDTVVLAGCVNTNPPVPVMGGTGAFTGPVVCAAPYSALPTVCVIHSDPELTVPPSEVAPELCTFGFSGAYANIVCGTGSASGTATVTSASENYNVSFSVIFVAGQGVLTGTAPTDDGTDVFAGPVDILPTSPFPPGCPVSQFRFTATLVAVDQ